MADYVVVALLGMLVGGAELISRYRDAPQAAVFTWSGFLYIALNASAALVALILVHDFDLKFGQSSESTIRVLQVLVAGTAAMAFFRSSVFTARIGDKDVAIGPAAFLTVLLTAVDREVDRARAKSRAMSVTKTMAGIDFDLAKTSLPTFSVALMQNLPADQQTELSRQINELANVPMLSNQKAMVLGLLLMNYVGSEVLASAVAALKDDVSKPVGKPSPQPLVPVLSPTGSAGAAAQPPGK